MKSPTKTDDELRQISLRLEPDLHSELVELARKDRRSFNSYVTVLFERHVEEAKAAA